MKVNFINGYKSFFKQNDKIVATLRISKLTIFALDLDISDKKAKIMLFNIGFVING